jgi:hypothetical protein
MKVAEFESSLLLHDFKAVECRWSDGRAAALNLQENTHFSTQRGMKIMNYVQVFLCIRESSVVKRVEIVSGIMSLCRCCHIIVLYVHPPTEYKTDDVKDRFYQKLKHVFHKFPKCHIKILLGEFNTKVCREDLFQPTFENEKMLEICNDNGVR